MGGETVTVVGRHRGSHLYVTMNLPTNCLTNLRVNLVYSPYVTRQISDRGMYKVGGQPIECKADWGGSEVTKTRTEERKKQFEFIIERMQDDVEKKRLNAISVQQVETELDLR